MIDKYGKCPVCGRSWIGHNMYNSLRNLSVFSHKEDKTVLALAGKYGYTQENQAIFSRVTIHELEEGTFYQCPSIRCNLFFNSETGEAYASLSHVKQGIPISKDEREDESDNETL